MRISILVRVFPPRFEVFIINQIGRLLDRGHDVTIVAKRRGMTWENIPDTQCPQFRSRIRYRPHIPRSRAGKAIKGMFLAARQCIRRPALFYRVLRSRSARRTLGTASWPYETHPFAVNSKFDVVHCQYASLGEKAIALRTIGAIDGKIAVSIRGGADMLWLSSVSERTRRTVFAEVTRFLTVSEFFRKRLIYLGCPNHKVVIHRSGINITRLESIAADARSACETERPTLVSVGRLEENKGMDTVLHATKALRDEGIRLQYGVVGDGPDRTKLVNLASQLGLNGHVQFRGWLPHGAAVRQVAECDVFVLPCLTTGSGQHEGIPNAIKEAMALGKPVVSTFHSGIPELVEDGVSGFLVPERDVVGLANRLKQLLANPDLRHRMGDAGRRHVTEHYDSEKLCTELEHIYQQAIAD